MFYYCLYGLNVQSDIEFSQFKSEENNAFNSPTVTISECTVPSELLAITDKKYEFGMKRSWLSNRTAWIIVENGEKIRYSLKPKGNIDYLKTYLLGFGMAMLAMQQEKLALHCSAVANDRGAILIAGESGAGKSTLTSALLDEAYKFMADDMVLAFPRKGESAIVSPSFPFQKLCRDVAKQRAYDLEELLYINEEKDKFLVPCNTFFLDQPQKVCAMFILGKTNKNKVVFTELRGIIKLKAVANNLFLRHLLGSEKYSPIIGQMCLNLAEQTPIYYIGRPEGLDSRNEIKNFVLQQLSSIL